MGKEMVHPAGMYVSRRWQMVQQPLDKLVAREIVERVGGSGQPPEYGFQFFTVGFDDYLKTIEEEYLSSYIKQNGKAFKLVVGYYGGGKTHFLYCIREMAWKHNFAVSYVELTEKSTPFHKLDSVYKAIVNNLMYPMSPAELLSGYEKGIDNFIRVWYQNKKSEFEGLGLSGDALMVELNRYLDSIKNIENQSFSNAVRQAFRCLIEGRDDDFSLILQWLQGAPYLAGKTGHSQFRILDRIDSSNAFRSTVQWTKSIGYSGLVILFDEAEQRPSMSGSQKNTLLSNLVDVINETGRGSLNSSMFYYAVPSLNFLQGKTDVYEALNQRLSTVFDRTTPTGVKILLDDMPGDKEEILRQIGIKLARVFETAYSIRFDDAATLERSIGNIAQAAADLQHTESGYRRLFVKKLIKGLELLRVNPNQAILPEKAKVL
jgi:hypothetical protein